MKRYSKCGEEKPDNEFYANKINVNGTVCLASSCKACRKSGIAKRRAANSGVQYRTLDEVREAAPKCDYCGVMLSRGHADGCMRPQQRPVVEPWELRCRQMVTKLNKEEDPWKKRCASATVSLRLRPKSVMRGPAKPRQAITWESAVARAIRSLHKKPIDHWKKRCMNAATLLRRRRRKREELSYSNL